MTMSVKAIVKILVHWLLMTCAVNFLSGCATEHTPNTAIPAIAVSNASTELAIGAKYQALVREGGRVFNLDPKASSIRLYAFRGGKAGKLGHNHVLSAPSFIGYFYLPQSGANNGQFDLEFRWDALEIDNPEYRKGLGDAFAKVLDSDAISGTREHLLGQNGVDAEKYPLIRIRSMEISGEAPKFAAKIEVEMHGSKQLTWVPLTVTGLPDAVDARGSLVLRQTDFGIQPYSVLGGLLAVRDEVVVEFQLVAK